MREARRLNLTRLAQQYEYQYQFADAIEISHGFLYQILANKRNVGEKLARKIEGRLNKPENWLDSLQNKHEKYVKLPIGNAEKSTTFMDFQLKQYVRKKMSPQFFKGLLGLEDDIIAWVIFMLAKIDAGQEERVITSCISQLGIVLENIRHEREEAAQKIPEKT